MTNKIPCLGALLCASLFAAAISPAAAVDLRAPKIAIIGTGGKNGDIPDLTY